MMNNFLPLSVIHCSGADAADFLHNQLSQSVKDLTPQQARLFNYCSPRGRILANGLVWKAVDNQVTASQAADASAAKAAQFYLLVHHSVAQSFLQRLQMFVLRAKVSFSLLEAQVAARENPFENTTASSTVLTATDWSLPIHYNPTNPNLLAIQAPGLKESPLRFWQIALGSDTTVDTNIVDPQLWGAQELQTGWAWVNSATADVFLPQNLNQDLIPAVNFSKGCFPGQEVVARSHYRATIRRRVVLVASQAAQLAQLSPELQLALAGTDIVTLTNKEPRIAGRVAAAVSVHNKFWALIETNLDLILNRETLYLAEYSTEPLHLEILPYQDELPWEKNK